MFYYRFHDSASAFKEATYDMLPFAFLAHTQRLLDERSTACHKLVLHLAINDVQLNFEGDHCTYCFSVTYETYHTIPVDYVIINFNVPLLFCYLLRKAPIYAKHLLLLLFPISSLQQGLVLQNIYSKLRGFTFVLGSNNFYSRSWILKACV